MRSIEIPQPEDRDWRYRIFEILPGLITWFILLLPVVLSIISPKLAAYFIIAYLLLWFVRALATSRMSVAAREEERQCASSMQTRDNCHSG